MKKKRLDYKKIVEQLKELFPYGHPDFISKAIAECKLHSDKNHDYAFGGSPLGNFERVSSILSNYPGLDLSDPAIIAMIYTLKQIDAYLWFKCKNHTAIVEGKGARLKDVAVYSKIMDLLDERDIEE